MIRLGSLAGYPFEGPRVLAGWTPPSCPAVFAILSLDRPDEKPNDYAVIYVGYSEDLSSVGLPLRHPLTPTWLKRAGSKWRLHICTYEVPGGLPSHRAQIASELIALYQPSCNAEQYDRQWKDEWIGTYHAPTTGALTTPRTLSDPSQDPGRKPTPSS